MDAILALDYYVIVIECHYFTIQPNAVAVITVPLTAKYRAIACQFQEV
jgi:hypothetical protein